jgi:DNA-directed RNA polymerase subunit RPC12/RpoP
VNTAVRPLSPVSYHFELMSSKGKIYKQHYACFRCRKAFKKTNIQEIPKRQLHIDEGGRVVHCPQCGERMPDVGYDFEPPKQDDIKGWKEAESRLRNSLDFMISNSAIVSVQSRRKRMKFIKKLDSMNRAESMSSLSSKGTAKKKRKG